MKSTLCLLVCMWITACENWSWGGGFKVQKETPFHRIWGDDKQKTHITRRAPACPQGCHSFLQGNLLSHCHTDTCALKHNNYGLHSKAHSFWEPKWQRDNPVLALLKQPGLVCHSRQRYKISSVVQHKNPEQCIYVCICHLICCWMCAPTNRSANVHLFLPINTLGFAIVRECLVTLTLKSGATK